MTTEIPPCCLQAFPWNGTPTGRVDTIESNQTYITDPNRSSTPSTANTRIGILIIHDMLGWTFPNIRLLADTFATQTGSTVYVPDFFGGENEILAVATELRCRHDILIAIGYCWGGWAAFRLGAEDPYSPLADQRPLADGVIVAHPSLLTKEDIDGVVVPTQVLAPEHDPIFNEELKKYTFDSFVKRGVKFDWQHFPGVEHACMSRGDTNKPGEKEALERGMGAVVSWVRYVGGVTKV
ncbi:dienelactone hydrolase family protein [Aspergillus stella-maris]|uniref:dienelactone hydrolase family protein n=1 Tax=Aspergillus stella-maris TaxID=1810926 RepID=UPI003CCD0496